jgi:HAD superfamily hydrolase (TIGR01509 family)
MNITAENILCDFDGTLVDSLGTMYDVYNNFAYLYKFNPDINEFNKLNGPSLFEISHYLKQKHNLKEDTKILHETYINLIKNSYKNNVSPFPGANELLFFCQSKNIKVYLITSSYRNIIENLLTKLQWDKLFTGFIFGDQVKKSKPDSAIYKLAIKKFSILPTETVVLEDSVNGVASASNAGLKTIGIGNEVKLAKAGACATFKTLNDFLKEMK